MCNWEYNPTYSWGLEGLEVGLQAQISGYYVPRASKVYMDVIISSLGLYAICRKGFFSGSYPRLLGKV